PAHTWLLLVSTSSVFVPRCSAPRALPPFPTRRSSDLLTRLQVEHVERVGDRLRGGAELQLSGRRQQHRALQRAGRHLPRRHAALDRKSTRLNSSHVKISYAVFCLKKKNLLNSVLRVLP